MNRIWIVEMWMSSLRKPRWQPTIGAALTREDGREVLCDWRKRNPHDKFRLRSYMNKESSNG